MPIYEWIVREKAKIGPEDYIEPEEEMGPEGTSLARCPRS